MPFSPPTQKRMYPGFAPLPGGGTEMVFSEPHEQGPVATKVVNVVCVLKSKQRLVLGKP